MHSVPMPSQTPSPVSRARPTPPSASTRPTSAPKSSSRTTGQLGGLGAADELGPGRLPRSSLDSLIAVRKEKPSAMIAKTRTPTGQYQFVSSCGWLIFS